MEKIADLLTEEIEKAGKIDFLLEEEKIFDKNVKDVTIFYKLVGDSRFKLFRSNDYELVFVHLTEDWMRQAKVDLNALNCEGGLEVVLSWHEKEDVMSVRCAGKEEYVTVTATQIDD